VDKAEYPVGRFPVVKTWPVVDGGKFPVKAFEGEGDEEGDEEEAENWQANQAADGEYAK